MNKHAFLHAALVALVLIFVFATGYLWLERLDLSETNKGKVQDFYQRLSNSQVAFTDAG